MSPSLAATRAEARSWAVDHVLSLLEVWALVATFSGLVGAWQLLGVCRVARAGAKEFLGTLPRLLVCGGYSTANGGGAVSEVWGLNLATVRLEAMPALLSARSCHACCVVRGALVVLGGVTPRSGVPQNPAITSRVEMLSKGGRGVRGAAATVMRRDLLCCRYRVRQDPQRLGASTPARRRGPRLHFNLVSATGGSSHGRMHTAG